MKLLLSVVWMLFSLNSVANEVINCDLIFRNAENIIQVESPVWVTPQLPEDGVIQGFSINVLQQGNGELFQPESLKEGVCALDMMLDAKTREAMRYGVKDYLNSPSSGSKEEDFEKLWVSLDNRLNSMYVDSGMVSDTGVNLILSQMEIQFGIQRFGSDENHSPLQKEAAKNRIYAPNLVLHWVLMVYLDHLGVAGFEGNTFVDYLKSLD